MRRFMIFLLTFALSIALVSCASSSPASVDDDLTSVLESISAAVQPGTAGSSLKAAQQACVLMDWCCNTNMDEAAIRSVTEAFLAGKAPEDRQLFAVQLASVQSAAEYLMSEDGAGLLEDIGGPEGTLWPWPDAPQEKIEVILDTGHAEGAADPAA